MTTMTMTTNVMMMTTMTMTMMTTMMTMTMTMTMTTTMTTTTTEMMTTIAMMMNLTQNDEEGFNGSTDEGNLKLQLLVLLPERQQLAAGLHLMLKCTICLDLIGSKLEQLSQVKLGALLALVWHWIMKAMI